MSIRQIAPSIGLPEAITLSEDGKAQKLFGLELEGTLGARGFSCAVYGFGQVKFTDQSISLR